MTEITLEVDANNKAAIISRFQALGWEIDYEWYRNEHPYGVRFVWPHPEPAKYPELTDLLPPSSQ